MPAHPARLPDGGLAPERSRRATLSRRRGEGSGTSAHSASIRALLSAWQAVDCFRSWFPSPFEHHPGWLRVARMIVVLDQPITTPLVVGSILRQGNTNSQPHWQALPPGQVFHLRDQRSRDSTTT